MKARAMMMARRSPARIELRSTARAVMPLTEENSPGRPGRRVDAEPFFSSLAYFLMGVTLTWVAFHVAHSMMGGDFVKPFLASTAGMFLLLLTVRQFRKVYGQWKYFMENRKAGVEWGILLPFLGDLQELLEVWRQKGKEFLAKQDGGKPMPQLLSFLKFPLRK